MFVPYRPLPQGHRRLLLWLLPLLTALALLLGLVLPWGQDADGPGGRLPLPALTGWLLDGPGAPQLLLPTGLPSDHGATRRVLLAGPGKTAPPAAVLAQSGHWVRLRGSVFARGDLRVMNVRRSMRLKLPPGSKQPLPGLAAAVDLGPVELTGEIVDAKCFSGVMKPGAGKTHRGCAIRCISGGVPALLHTDGAGPGGRDVLLIDNMGGAVNSRIAPLIADRLRVRGQLLQLDNLVLLRADPSTYQPA
jgi:hypothetical protein